MEASHDEDNFSSKGNGAGSMGKFPQMGKSKGDGKKFALITASLCGD